MFSDEMTRRAALRRLAAITATLLIPQTVRSDTPPAQRDLPSSPASTQPATQPIMRDGFGDLLPKRKLGRSGETVTMLGVGGAHIEAVMDEAEAQRVIETAIAGGVRFFDNAFMYGNGKSEEIYGRHLTPRYRDVIFLMTKTNAHSGDDARKMLDGSLRRLKTDHLDLWQLHDISSPDDADHRVSNGVLDAALEAQAAGKCRFIGFTGHRTPDAHLKMLDHSRQLGQTRGSGDVFQTVQMPVNLADPSYNSFILRVMPTLVERGFGILAMKTLSNGGFFGGTQHFKHGPNPKVCPDRVSIADAIHFVWSLPVSVLITGAHNSAMLQEKIDLARAYAGMTSQRQQELIDRVSKLAGKTVEFYKA